MDYRWKDIFVTILPGANLQFLLCVFMLCESSDSRRLIEQIFSQDIFTQGYTLLALLFPLLCIILGYVINETNSCIVRCPCSDMYLKPVREILHSKKSLCIVPDDVLDDLYKQIGKEKGENDQTDRQIYRKVKDSLSPNKKVEEYFVHYAQAQNMFGSHVFALIISICIILFSNLDFNVKAVIIWMVYDIVGILLFLKKRNDHYKRYVQIIFAEYINNHNKVNVEIDVCDS